MLRSLFAGLFCACARAAQQQPSAAPPAADQQAPTFRGGVEVVVAPVTVTDRDGNYVNGLQPYQFHLFDNDKEQDIKVDVSYEPISIVIAIQANDHVEAVLPQINKIGTLIEPLVIGDQGEAAVLAFDHRIRTMQDFTSDPQKIKDAIKKIHPGSTQNAINDAVMAGVRMLRTRPQNRRRILLLISETRQNGSTMKAREPLIEAQLANVVIYSVDISRFVTTLTAPPRTSRPDPLPPAMRPLPPNVPATPTTVQQTWGTNGNRMEFVPLMIEIIRDVKNIFVDNPVELFTKGTGGTEYGFMKQRGLEDAMERVGTDLHSQYIVSYNPNNKDEGGFHEIKVTISGRPDARTRTRPGYWLGPK